jgi:hypothetical protein
MPWWMALPTFFILLSIWMFLWALVELANLVVLVLIGIANLAALVFAKKSPVP